VGRSNTNCPIAHGEKSSSLFETGFRNNAVSDAIAVTTAIWPTF
jgi:hypothetical protein